jgi:DNA excision repair protein ERCC-2
VAEGIDFDRHYGRCVVLMGIPFQYTLSKVLRVRLEYLRETFQIPEADYLTFDAIRQAAQCVGRVIRSKKDYGLMIFADQRYGRYDKRSKLPQWIQKNINEDHYNLSTDMCIDLSRQFLTEMAQPFDAASAIGWGKSMLSIDDLEAVCEDDTGPGHGGVAPMEMTEPGAGAR